MNEIGHEPADNDGQDPDGGENVNPERGGEGQGPSLDNSLRDSEKTIKSADSREYSDPIAYPARPSVMDMLDPDLKRQIIEQEAKRGIETDSQRMLEAALYMEDKYREIAIISGEDRPELLFGAEEWASYLEARNFAHDYKGELTVDFILDIHAILSKRTQPEAGGKFRDDNAFWCGIPPVPYTADEIAAIEENPLLTHVPPFDPGEYGVVLSPKVGGPEGARQLRILQSPLTEAEQAAIDNDPLAIHVPSDEVKDITRKNGCALYPCFAGPERAREQLQLVVDDYNKEIREGRNPVEVAAKTQRTLSSLHLAKGDYNGRDTRMVMNWILEKHGFPPSAAGEFNDDYLTSERNWINEVEAGCARYEKWTARLAELGDNADPVEVFDLEPEQRAYWVLLGPHSGPFVRGEIHYAPKYAEELTEVRRTLRNEVIHASAALFRTLHLPEGSAEKSKAQAKLQNAMTALEAAITEDMHNNVAPAKIMSEHGIGLEVYMRVLAKYVIQHREGEK